MLQKKLGKCPRPGCHSTNFYYMVRLSTIKKESHYRCRPCGLVFPQKDMVPYPVKVSDAKIKKNKSVTKLS